MWNITSILSEYGYVGMFMMALIENGIFFFLPGDSMLIASGVMSSADIFNPNIVIMMFALGSFLGNIIGYEIGKKLEIYRERHIWLRRILKDEYLSEAHYMFAKYGDRIVLVQRYIPMLRTFGPMVAGAVGMRYNLFLTYSLVGAFVWAISLVYPSYWLGNRVPGLERHVELIVLTILFVTIFPVAYQLYRRYRSRSIPK